MSYDYIAKMLVAPIQPLRPAFLLHTAKVKQQVTQLTYVVEQVYTSQESDLIRRQRFSTSECMLNTNR